MKQKVWIILSLAALMLALGCATAMAGEGLGFVTQPTVGRMDTEALTIPVTWKTTFSPTKVRIAYYNTYYEAFREEDWDVTAQKDGAYPFPANRFGTTFRIHAYYASSSYIESDTFELPRDPALAFTAQPAVGAMDTEQLTMPVTWQTGFLPTKVKIAYYNTYYEAFREENWDVTAQKDGAYPFPANRFGTTFRIHAYYASNSYIESDTFELPRDPAFRFTVQPAVGAMDTEQLTVSVTWQTGFLPTKVKIAYYDTYYEAFRERDWNVTAQKDGAYPFPLSAVGMTYRIHAYYTSGNYFESDPFPLKFIDVTLDPNGAPYSANTIQVVSGATFTLPACGFTWAHHLFDKWQIGTEYYDPGDTVTVTESVTVRAVWKRCYTITFSPGSGSGAGGAMEPLMVPVNETFTLPACAFTPPEGKIFSRWGASGDLYYQAGDTITATANLLFVAQWRTDRTTVGFDRNGGTGSMNPVSLTPAQASEYTLPECTYAPPADCVFETWQVILPESGEAYYGEPGDLVYLSGCFNVTLKAIWAAKPSYEVSFNANGHGTAPQPQSVMQDKYAVDPGALSAEGYTFLGWYTEAAGTHRFSFATTRITGPITLYARWADTITSIEISGFAFPAAGMRSVRPAQITTGNTGYVCTRIEWRFPSAGSASGYGYSYDPITFVSNTEYTAVITLETVRDILFDPSAAPELVTINGQTAGVDLTRSGYVSKTQYQLYTVPVVTENAVPIDAAHFPDAAFRAVLQGRSYDLNGDGAFSLAEIGVITSLNVSNKGIASLQGIGILDELKSLNAVGNALTSLDLSNNWALEEVYCSGNPNLAELTLPKGSRLKQLQCYGCALTGLDVRGITYLAQAAAQAPVVSPNGQDKTYTCSMNGVVVSKIITDAAVTLYSDSAAYARVCFEPGPGTGTMPSVMASKSASYTLPANGFTAPEDMYFDGWLLSSTGESFSAGETMDRLFTITEHEITFIAQWKTQTILTITVPDATNTVLLGGAPVDFSYNGAGSLNGGYWLSAYSSTGATENVVATRLNPNMTYYAAIRFPTNVSVASLINQITQGRFVVKNADVVNVTQYAMGSSNRTFLIVSLQPRTVGVLFGKGGGSGFMRPVTGIIPGSAYTLPPCDFTAPADMVFDQWSLGAPGTTITLDHDAALIARWKPEDGAVPVTADFFPDEAFRRYVSEIFDVNGGGYLTAAEIANALTLYYDSDDIGSFAGIEYLTELEEFECADNSLTGLDLSGNTRLVYLECQRTGIPSLALDALSGLSYLDCSDNSLTALDVSAQRLEFLDCQGNPLTSLRLGGQATLKTLDCFGTALDTLDLRACPLLLDCVENGARTVTANYVEYRVDDTHALRVDADTELILPGMIAVDEANFPDAAFRLWVTDIADRNGSGWLTAEERDTVDAICLNVPAYANLAGVQGIEYFTGITELIIDGAPSLTAVDLSENTKLASLEITQTGLTELYVSGLPLEYLNCMNNALTSLALGSQPHLTELVCCGNPTLKTLDLRQAPCLEDAALNGVRSVTDSGHLYEGPLGGQLRVDADTELIVPGVIRIDAAHFPDPDFRDHVASNFDTNMSGWLSREEIAAVTSLSMDGYDDLEAVTGIEYFTGLNRLQLTNNPHLAIVDLSRNAGLTTLDLEYNDLTALPLDGLTSLRNLYISGNRLEALDVSALPALKTLDCGGNPLTSLILGESPALDTLVCCGTNLTSLDISGAPHLVAAWLGTRDSSHAEFDRYTANGAIMDVDKGLSIVTGIPAPTFILPADLTSIEADAFQGIAAGAVLIPASVTAISGNPFAGSGVRYIYGATELVRTFAEAYGYTFVPVRD